MKGKENIMTDLVLFQSTSSPQNMLKTRSECTKSDLACVVIVIPSTPHLLHVAVSSYFCQIWVTSYSRCEHHPEIGSQCELQLRAGRQGLQCERGPGAGRCCLNTEEEAECCIQHLGFIPPIKLMEDPQMH